LFLIYVIERTSLWRSITIHSEIEKTARKNSRKKKKVKQGAREESSTSSNRDTQVNQKGNMVEGERAPPRRTLGDYAMQQGPRHFSSIAIPTATKTLEVKLTFLNLISTHQFTRIDHEYPYAHLSRFYELVGTMGFEEGDIEFVYIFHWQVKQKNGLNPT